MTGWTAADYSAVAGGISNTAAGQYSTVLGGYTNTTSAYHGPTP